MNKDMIKQLDALELTIGDLRWYQEELSKRLLEKRKIKAEELRLEFGLQSWEVGYINTHLHFISFTKDRIQLRYWTEESAGDRDLWEACHFSKDGRHRVESSMCTTPIFALDNLSDRLQAGQCELYMGIEVYKDGADEALDLATEITLHLRSTNG